MQNRTPSRGQSQNGYSAQANVSVKPPKKKKKSGVFGRIVRRFFLLLFTILILVIGALALVMNLVFNGPSPAARKVLTMSLLEPSATKWIPGLFMDEAVVDSIRNEGSDKEIDTSTNLNEIVINRGGSISGSERDESISKRIKKYKFFPG